MRRAWKRAEEKKIRRQVKTNNSFSWRETLIRAMMPSALAASLMMTTMNGVVMAQQIVADGKTQTQVSVNGNVTDITTSTISGQNAYNSFNYFNVDEGNIANFYLPDSTTNLLNVVSNPVGINGMVNSIKNGNIGGNMYFITPGFVVGESGVLNVGSLKVVTPTQDYINNFFVTPGVPSETETTAVLNGQDTA